MSVNVNISDVYLYLLCLDSDICFYQSGWKLHRAFTFEIEQKKHKAHSDVFINDSDDEDFDTVAVSAQLSSVVYIHSSTSLAELNSCADYFKRCMNICCCY